MFGLDRLLQLFADQFEQDGEGYLYRRGMRQAAIRVTAEERLQFIREFGRGIRSLLWVFVIAVVVAIAGIDLIAGTQDTAYVDYITTGVLLIGYLLAYRYVSNAPWRALRTRAVPGRNRSHAEMRARALARITWGQLALAAVAAIFGLEYVATRYDLMAGWNRLWLAVAVIYFIMLAFQVLQKWRLGNSGRAQPEATASLPQREIRPSWWRIAGGVFVGWTTGNLIGGIISDVAFQTLKLAGGMPDKFGAIADVPAIVWLVLLAVVITGTTIGQGAAAIFARWSKAAWVAAALYASLFFLLYWLSGRKPMLLGLVLLPLVTAYFVQRNGYVRRTIAARQDFVRAVAY